MRDMFGMLMIPQVVFWCDEKNDIAMHIPATSSKR